MIEYAEYEDAEYCMIHLARSHSQLTLNEKLTLYYVISHPQSILNTEIF